MRVLVTGGTGFLGSHSVRALLDAGHEVRLLVRSPARIAPALGPLGIDRVDHVVGDITDRASVEAALEGCEALLHAANVFELDPRRGEEMLAVNPKGTDLVLRAAHERGLDPLIHVSSIVALMPSAGTLTPATPLGSPPGPYARSKVEAERIARELAGQGAPVVIVCPAALLGPGDPYVGGSVAVTRDILCGRIPLVPPGALPIVDVRDVAALNAAALVAGRGPRRYVVGAGNLSLAEITAEARRLTGRRLPTVPISAGLGLAAARAADFSRRFVAAGLPISFEGVWLTVNGPQLDSSAAEEELGAGFRAPIDAVADTVKWLAASGRISRRRAGLLGAGGAGGAA